MNKNLINVARGIVVAAGVSLCSLAMAADVRIGTEGAYPPWNFMDDDGKVAGFEIELGNRLCEKAGVTCEWVINEWDSIIPNLVAGNYDVIMAGMSITAERSETITFSEEYYPPTPSRFAAIKGADVDFDNIKGLKLGAQGATIQADYLEDNYKDGNTILTFETPDQSVADLAAGNLDLLLADGDYLGPVVEGSGGAMELVGEGISIGGGVGMGMRQDATDLQAKMAEALAALKADGTLDELIKEFFEQDTSYASE